MPAGLRPGDEFEVYVGLSEKRRQDSRSNPKHVTSYGSGAASNGTAAPLAETQAPSSAAIELYSAEWYAARKAWRETKAPPESAAAAAAAVVAPKSDAAGAMSPSLEPRVAPTASPELPVAPAAQAPLPDGTPPVLPNGSTQLATTVAAQSPAEPRALQQLAAEVETLRQVRSVSLGCPRRVDAMCWPFL